MQVTKTSWKKGAIYLGILPAVLLYVVMGLGPSIATFFISFTDISGLPGTSWKTIGLQNYKEFLVLQNYRDTFDAIKRTFIFSGLVTFVQNGIALFIAIVFNNKFLKGRNFFRAVVFMPTVLGVMVTSLCWNIFFSSDGMASKLIGLFGAHSSFFADRHIAFYLVIWVQIWMAMGYSMVIFLAGLQSISNDLYEAGSIDGTTPAQAFRYITFPLLWPTITVNVILALIGSLSTFQTILFTTGGDFDTSTLAMRIYGAAFGIGRTGQAGLRQGYAAAQSMILFIIVLTVTLIFQRWMNRKEQEI